MHGYVKRFSEAKLVKSLSNSPVTAILGPRQCGKSTLAKNILASRPSVYLDLQDRVDRNKLTEPELFFDKYRENLICLDEIQLVPEFFAYLRSEIDKDRRPGRFLILGSASRDLIRQSTESLAGRISYLDLTPFLLDEIQSIIPWQDSWLRGGFPDSVLASDNSVSYEWRENFIRTFMERDIPGLGFQIPAPVIERLWLLLAHYHGQTVNYSKMATAADLSIPSLKKYLSILEQTNMVRILKPAESNLKKRLIKSPKVYLKDSGILHTLLGIEEYDFLLANPLSGASWEGYVLDNMLPLANRWKPSFIRTSNGAEVDLLLERGGRYRLFEFKLSKAPRPSRGFYEIVSELKPEMAVVVAPVEEPYDLKAGVQVCPLGQLKVLLGDT